MFTFFCKQSFFYLCKAERPTESLNLRYEIFGSALPCISNMRFLSFNFFNINTKIWFLLKVGEDVLL
jgi:hypothetical protein